MLRSGADADADAPDSSPVSPKRGRLRVSYVIPALAAGIFAVAAASDLRRRRIPNALPVALVVLGIARLSIEADPAAALYTVVAAAAVFGGGCLLFWRGLVGGGDVKLTAAAVLLLGHQALPVFLLAMSFFGLAVTVMMLIAAKVSPRLAAEVPATAEAAARPTIPYGVAIAAAGVLILLLQPPIPG